MANDSSLYVRRAVIRALKQVPGITDRVAQRVYPPQRPANPVWPFIGYGVPSVTPVQATCLDGCEVRPAIHVYAVTEGEGPQTVDGEHTTHLLLALVAETLDGATFDLTDYDCPYPATAHVTWVSSQVRQDQARVDAFHGIGQYSITVSS